MEGSLAAALVVTGVALVAFALFAFLFWRGALLYLLAGKAALEPEGADADACRTLGRRMAIVLMVGCALMATLVVYLAAELTLNAPLASVASMANNVAFIALVVALIWFFVVQRPNREKDEELSRPAARARAATLDHLHIGTILFVIALLAIVGLVGIVAAL